MCSQMQLFFVQIKVEACSDGSAYQCNCKGILGWKSELVAIVEAFVPRSSMEVGISADMITYSSQDITCCSAQHTL